MSSGVLSNGTAKHRVFREMVRLAGDFEKLPDRSFEESGTGVRTVLVLLRRP
jgi:hypothetical protein